VEVVTMSEGKNRLSNLQLELLKLFKYSLNEAQLLEIKDLLARHFAKQATNEADKIWKDQGLSNDTMDQWLNEHKRVSSTF